MSLKKVFVLLILTTIVKFSAVAQYDCPSKMASKLKSIKKTPISWCGEYIVSGGGFDDLEIYNQMIFAGLDFSKGNHNLYVEGGYKNWIRKDTTEFTNTMSSFGLREAFYKYQNQNLSVTLGLQSSKSDDYYLMNERIVGADLKYRSQAFEHNLKAGSVQKQFARNGTFCTVGYLYNVVPGRERAIIANNLGQSNFALYTLSFFPAEFGKKKAPANQSEFATDEFGNAKAQGGEFSVSSEFDTPQVADTTKQTLPDEFASAEEFTSTPKKKLKLKLNLSKAGLLAYSEFGEWVAYPFAMLGVYDELNVNESFRLKTEMLYQHEANNKALIYTIGAEQQFKFGSQQTKLYATYLGLHRIDSLARALNSYSNVFAGEVLRLDALELPILMAGLKHSFSKIKTSVRLQYAQQFELNPLSALDKSRDKAGKQMQEIDLILTTNFLKYFQIMLQGGYLNYNFLEHDYVSNTNDFYQQKDTFFGRVELRISF